MSEHLIMIFLRLCDGAKLVKLNAVSDEFKGMLAVARASPT